jgi:bifunctional enzyme CysN/CysC
MNALLHPNKVSEIQPSQNDKQLKVVIVGHVDHGKSTLVGRLLHDTDSLPEGKFAQIKASSERRGMPFEWSFLMDALQTERDQGITIDTTQIWFKTDKRGYCIIDAPGHKEFLKNMITGAASSDAALLLIDAEEGVKEQSRRHGYLLHLLGVRQIAVIVNKVDLIDYNQRKYQAIVNEYSEYLASIGVKPSCFIPISARNGDNMVSHSQNTPWYSGYTVIEALDAFCEPLELDHMPLRFPVQDVYKFDERRIIAGRIESGSLAVGDEILFSPSNKIARVKSIESSGQWPVTSNQCYAGQSIGITLDEQIFVERGEVITHLHNAPKLSNTFKARIFWLGKESLIKGRVYKIKINTAEIQAELRAINAIIDASSLEQQATSSEANSVERHMVAEVVFRVKGMAALDDFSDNSRTGRFVIVDGYDIAGGGIINLDGISDQRVAARATKSKNIFPTDNKITKLQRSRMNGHSPGILWFTGLSGSGKSTLANELQQQLFSLGMQVYVLDGDNVRGGLNSDLGFSHEDRAENIRRIGEVAALFADAGFIVISSFIAPYAEDRRRARAAASEYFHTIYIKADLETCESRDPKGLYKKARAGEITQFTGITDPYEEPENADLVIDTAHHSVEECVSLLVDYVRKNFIESL